MNPDNPTFRTPEEEARAAEFVKMEAKLLAALLAIADLTVDLEFSRRELQAFKAMMTTANVGFLVGQNELDHIMPSDADRFIRDRLVKLLSLYLVDNEFVKITEEHCVEGRKFRANVVVFK